MNVLNVVLKPNDNRNAVSIITMVTNHSRINYIILCDVMFLFYQSFIDPFTY